MTKLKEINTALEKIKKKRMAPGDIKLRSWEQCARNITQLALAITGKKYKNTLFLKKKEEVKHYIENLKKKNSDESVSLSKKRLLYMAILVILSPDRTDIKRREKKLYKHYSGDFYKLTQEYVDIQTEQKKSIKQDKNWESWDTLLDLQKKLGIVAKTIIELKKLTKNKDKYAATRPELKAIQDWVIISLYTLIKPRRLDYAKMIIVTQANYNKMTTEEIKSYNYLVIAKKNKMSFSFGKDVQKNKNKNAAGFMLDCYILTIPSDLQKILTTVLKIKQFTATKENKRHLLQDSRRLPIKSDILSKQVKKITAQHLHKNISASMFRTIYLSDKHQHDIPTLEKQKTAEEMGHNASCAEKCYTKH